MRARGAVLLVGVSLLASAAASAATPLPKLVSATVAGDRVTLTFTGALRPRTGAWTVLVNGKPVVPTGVVFAGRRAQLRLPAGVYSDDVVRVAVRNLRSAKGFRLGAVGTTPVNRSAPGCSEQLGTVVEGVHREGPTDPKTFLPAGGFRLYAVHVDFPDFPTRSTETMSFEGIDRTIRDLSYGRSSVTGAGYPTKLRMLKNGTEYVHTGPWSGRRALLADVLAQVDPFVDLRDYDGLVLQVTFGGNALQRPVVDPYVIAPPGEGLAADGKELRHFFVGGVSLHALLQVAGLPGMHWTEVGGWDHMYFAGGGRNLLAWHRRKLGWLTPAEVRCLRDRPLEVALAPTWRGGGVKALIVGTGPTSAVVLENRQKQGADAGICRRGILPYRVDTQAPTSKIRMLHVEPPGGPCSGGYAPHDLSPGQTVRVGDAVSVELLGIDADDTYRLRVSR